jgi:hypothetical protein
MQRHTLLDRNRSLAHETLALGKSLEGVPPPLLSGRYQELRNGTLSATQYPQNQAAWLTERDVHPSIIQCCRAWTDVRRLGCAPSHVELVGMLFGLVEKQTTGECDLRLRDQVPSTHLIGESAKARAWSLGTASASVRNSPISELFHAGHSAEALDSCIEVSRLVAL